MAKKKDVCEECGSELGEDGICIECRWSKEGGIVEEENSEEEKEESEEEEEEL
jgi:hypothetical protein